MGHGYGDGGRGGEGEKAEADEEEAAFVPPFEVPEGMETVSRCGSESSCVGW